MFEIRMHLLESQTFKQDGHTEGVLPGLLALSLTYTRTDTLFLPSFIGGPKVWNRVLLAHTYFPTPFTLPPPLGGRVPASFGSLSLTELTYPWR